MNRSIPTPLAILALAAVIAVAVMVSYSQSAPPTSAGQQADARPVAYVITDPFCKPCARLKLEWNTNRQLRELIEAGYEVRFIEPTGVPTVVTPDGQLHLFKNSDFVDISGRPLLGLLRMLHSSRSPPGS